MNASEETNHPKEGEQVERDLYPEPEAFTPDPRAELFYSGASARIVRNMPVIALPVILICWVAYGWRFGLGLLLGCALSYQNFRWLVQAIEGLSERVVNSQSKESGAGIVTRFVVRMLLMALATYVIFSVSKGVLFGLLAGFFLPVAAILCEAAFELFAATRRGL